MARGGRLAKHLVPRYWIGLRLSLAPICRGGELNPSDIFPGPLTRIQTRFVETFDQHLMKGQEIVCVTSDRDRAAQIRVAVGTRCRIVHVFILGANAKLQSVFSVDLETTVPIALGFAGNNTNDLIVFGMFDGKMYVPSP
jgi:hypothetical protein